MFEDGQANDYEGRLTWRTLGVAAALHVALFLFFWVVGIINFRKPDVIIPIDMTIVPPWAQQTDDPDPDPAPPPPEVKQPKPPPRTPPPERIETKPNVDAVEKVPEKKKPEKKKPEKVDLKKNAKLVKTPPKPQKSLKDSAKVVTPAPVPVERPPDLKIPDNVKRFGKGTAADKPLKDIDMKKMLDQGYRYGARNQLAESEEQRCVSLIKAAVLREWNKESFKWYSGLRPIQVNFQLGAGGAVAGFSIRSGSGDAEVDATAQNALRRLKANGRIAGLSAQFLEKFPNLTIVMEPTQGR